jgi:hypothetical protein
MDSDGFSGFSIVTNPKRAKKKRILMLVKDSMKKSHEDLLSVKDSFEKEQKDAEVRFQELMKTMEKGQKIPKTVLASITEAPSPK